jgi:hypothetical protein
MLYEIRSGGLATHPGRLGVREWLTETVEAALLDHRGERRHVAGVFDLEVQVLADLGAVAGIEVRTVTETRVSVWTDDGRKVDLYGELVAGIQSSWGNAPCYSDRFPKLAGRRFVCCGRRSRRRAQPG